MPRLDHSLNPMFDSVIDNDHHARPRIDDVERLPEPREHPPGAQWDEVQGVWIRWNDAEQTWEKVIDLTD